MKIFISQSGERSKALAMALAPFIRQIVPGAKPWVSDTHIDKGSRSMQEIRAALQDARAGVVCLTSDNLTSPWILFEGGALSGKLADRLWTVLLDVNYEQVEPPLGQFQHTAAEKEDLRKMIRSMNEVSDNPHAPADLDSLFEALWPAMSATIETIKAMPATVPAATARPQTELIAEMLETVRTLKRHDDTIMFRSDKTLRLLTRIYRAVVHEEPPSLAALHAAVDSLAGGAHISSTARLHPPSITMEPPLPLTESQKPDPES
jgi:hypothetical protein